MYAWPTDVDESLFAGRSVQAITFTENTLHVVFEPPCSITILSGLTFKMADGAAEVCTIPIRETRLPQTLGLRVKRATLVDRRDLHLALENGSELWLDGASDGYECYSVRLGEREFIV